MTPDEARKDCWCESYRKPCEYHEGYFDGWDARSAEIDRLREQAEALAEALEGLVEEVWPSEMIAEGIKPEEGVSVAGPVDGGTVADARAALRTYREPGSSAIHTKYLDDQLVERCITCLERWPCKEASHE